MKTRVLALTAVFCLGFLAAAHAQQPASKPSADKAKTKMAIVPFEDLTADEKMKQLVAGFSETLSSRFVRTGKFEVIERRQLAAIMKEQGFQGSGFADEKTAVEVGKIAGVEKIVIGSVQKAGSQMKVVARVVSVKTGRAETAHDVTGVVDEIFQLQDKLAMGLLSELGVELSEEAKTKVTQAPTKSVSAYESYSTALNQIDTGDYGAAISQLQEAIQQDPSYAEAYHALAQAYHEDGLLEQALDTYEKAVELYEAAGNYYGMVEAMTNAAELLHNQGQLDPASEIYQSALEVAEQLEDYYAQGRIFINLGWMAMELEMWQESFTYFEGAASIFDSLGEEEYYGQAAFGLGALYHATGDFAS